ncbi:MAG: magnesium transporter CorA [Hymenobacteraceae bacterium]|nr:magnesium transporter CorA [Hymenobacteraceae bacterium]MDX5397504.1 magnesium transporter CorA [Hymenobacteraceae bacterium]MDX5513583.1 magnesium transporter CorA [Hymenobacteraceae bacterium]
MVQALKQKENAEDWEWIDVSNPTPEELQQIADRYNLHPTSVKDCLQPEHLPKYEVIDNITFIITRVYDRFATSESDTIQELTSKIAVFYSNTFVITIHRQEQPVIFQVKQEYVDQHQIRYTSDLLLKIIRMSIKTYEPIGQKLAEDLDFYEAKIFLKANTPPLTKGLYHLKRKAAVVKKVLALSRVVLESLETNGTSGPEVQDLHDLFLRVQTMYDEINESINNLLNIYISLSSQRTNEVVRVLTIFSVFFMPLTFIGGIYGMNFSLMPELNWKYGYPLIILIMVMVTVSIYFWFKKKGWM